MGRNLLLGHRSAWGNRGRPVRALPKEFVAGIAGIALLGTIGNSLAMALTDDAERDAAVVTFLVTASALSLFGVGGAFWGL